MSVNPLTDWTDIVPVTRVGLRRNTVTLPEFTADTPDWKGASEIVLQYNYTATRAFYLTRLPTKPDDCNYGLCIRYRVGETEYRYKLWEDDNFILGDVAAPLYVNEIIKANFVLEVWSLNGETSVDQASAMTLITSLKTAPTDYRDVSAIALAYEEALTYDDLLVTFDTTETGFIVTTNEFVRYLGEDIVATGTNVTQWTDEVVGLRNFETISATPPQLVSAVAEIQNNDVIRMIETSYMRTGNASYRSTDSFLVIKLNDHIDQSVICTRIPTYIKITQVDSAVANSSAIRVKSIGGAFSVDINVPLDTWMIIHVTKDPSGSLGVFTHTVNVYDLLTGGLIGSGTFVTSNIAVSTSQIEYGDYSAAVNGAKFDVAAHMEFTPLLDADTAASVIQGLIRHFTLAFSSPTGTFATGNQWLDNE